jgi:hypothetical protein
MALITVQDARGWVETSKFPISDLDDDLLVQVTEEVIGRIRSAYDTAPWTSPDTTPRLVRTAIAKTYVAWLYTRAYSEDQDASAYSSRILANAERLITGILDGTIELPNVPPATTTQTLGPAYYPSDLSSALEPTDDDPSLGPAVFSMGMKF